MGYGHDLARGIDAVEAGHLDVHDDDVRLALRRYGDGLITGGGLADHLDVGRGIEQGAQRAQNHRMVVGDQDTCPFHVMPSRSAAGR